MTMPSSVSVAGAVSSAQQSYKIQQGNERSASRFVGAEVKEATFNKQTQVPQSYERPMRPRVDNIQQANVDIYA